MELWSKQPNQRGQNLVRSSFFEQFFPAFDNSSLDFISIAKAILVETSKYSLGFKFDLNFKILKCWIAGTQFSPVSSSSWSQSSSLPSSTSRFFFSSRWNQLYQTLLILWSFPLKSISMKFYLRWMSRNSKLPNTHCASLRDIRVTTAKGINLNIQ